MTVTAQFSLYPLGLADLGSTLEAAIAAARQVGVDVEVGRMSSFIEAEEELVFAALRAAFRAAAERGDAILVATVSNAC
jgi:uncharacterized protein YqgV (UPF0045/DUF77 family)